MTKTLTLVLATCAGMVLVTPAFANTDGAGKGPHDFSTLDADGNGQITQEEMTAHGAARFTRIDTDGDGFLSAAELEAAGSERAKKRSARMLKHLDADGDGQLSQAEMEKRGRGGKMFSRIDADGSGGISEEEFATAQKHMKKRHKKP